MTIPDLASTDIVFPPPPPILPLVGGLQFKNVAPMIAGIVDNGVCFDDPRVMVRLNEATKIVLDYMIPVGGMMITNIEAQFGILVLPPQMENIIEVHVQAKDVGGIKAYGNADTTQSWYEIVNNSAYLDPASAMDNPLTDLGLNGDPTDPSDVRRIYYYPGLQPGNAVVQCTGAKRFVPLRYDEDYLIIQNVEALKCIILSIERYENNAPDEAQKYRAAGFEILQAEVKKHIFDPRNYMVRKAGYYQDLVDFTPGTLGWTRAQVALDLPDALRISKHNLTWDILQSERRLMERGMWKDTVMTITAEVVGGSIYMPMAVDSVLAISMDGSPIPIRSQFFQHLDNGPGAFACHPMLVDQGDHKQPGFASPRRKYKLLAPCEEGSCITAVCKLRWLQREPTDMMVIKNYEAIRLMMSAKFLEEKEDWKNAVVNQQQAVDVLEKELRSFLGGIRHTVHIQTSGFGLGDVGGYGAL